MRLGHSSAARVATRRVSVLCQGCHMSHVGAREGWGRVRVREECQRCWQRLPTVSGDCSLRDLWDQRLLRGFCQSHHHLLSSCVLVAPGGNLSRPSRLVLSAAGEEGPANKWRVGDIYSWLPWSSCVPGCSGCCSTQVSIVGCWLLTLTPSTILQSHAACHVFITD